MIYCRWLFECMPCAKAIELWAWDADLPPTCPACMAPMTPPRPPTQAPSVIGDDIPGGVEIRHAICNPDGTPRRFYSKSSIRETARRAGWTIDGETPKASRQREV